MSLSQKHSGLVLVPWYNSYEWRYVYQLVYSNNRAKEQEALELLKIWKTRTPILSSGIEGTLILLDVLLVDKDHLSEEQVCNLYAVALMRFLNLSAANSDKQGSFKKTSFKNELPKWLINLRHDIAHGHQIPSKYNLKMGLDFGFQWLKEKYWDPQSKIIKDYNIIDESVIDVNTTYLFKSYVELNISLFENRELSTEIHNNIKNIVHKIERKKNLDLKSMLDILLKILSEKLEKEINAELCRYCLDILVSTKALLRIHYEEDENTIEIDQQFATTWSKLINLFHRHGLLFNIIERLFETIENVSYSHQIKKIASLWINEIYLALLNLKNPNDSEGNKGLALDDYDHFYSIKSLEFQKQVLLFSSDSNKYLTYFIDNLFKYNSSNEIFSTCVSRLITTDSYVNNLPYVEDKIFTLSDTELHNVEDEMNEVEIPAKGNVDVSMNNENRLSATNKWQKVEGSLFKNCPLGVLPHQLGKTHPFLILSQ